MAKFVKLFDAPTSSSKLVRDAVIVTTGGTTMMDTNTAQTATNKTFTSPVITGATQTINVAALAGTGANIATAALITTASPALIHATAGNNSVGIMLPVAAAGLKYTIKNAHAANDVMKVYAQVNSTINGISANTAISLAANTCCDFTAFNTTAWFTTSLLPS